MTRSNMTTRRTLLLATAALAVFVSTPAHARKRKLKKMSTPLAPPVAKRIPHTTTVHGVTLSDPYHWLKDKGYPEVNDAPVLEYLGQENAYYDAVMAPHKKLTETVFEELKGRVKDDDATVPMKDGAYIYQSRFAKGAQYRTHVRWPVSKPGQIADVAETVLLDEPALAKGKDYFKLGVFSISSNDRYLAYATDTNGAERFTLKIRDLQTGVDLPDVLEQVSAGELVWQADDKAFAYMELSEEWRPYRARLHIIGMAQKDDVLLYEEKDAGFFCGLARTTGRRYMLISTGDNITSEVRMVPVADLKAPAVLISPRKSGHEYSPDEREGRLYIRTNDTHKNFRIATAPADTPQQENWQELIAGSDKHYLRGLTTYKNHMAITENIDGLHQVRIRDYDGTEHFVAFPESSYSAGEAGTSEYDPEFIRLTYASMITPNTVYDYDIGKKTLIARKVQELPSGYDKSLYATDRLMAPARDGTLVPVSIVYRKDRGKNGGPLHLYAYGSYGYAVPPGFSANRLSLLDRGFAFAIAHIRGGDDMGYDWYLQGKHQKRWNTFNDFVDVGRHLVKTGYTAEKNISAQGGSAGGQVMGAITNAAPDLWKAVIADVPFVDVINTMMDVSLPLTPTEWPEWGNPIKNADDFKYMLSYSPYDNVQKKNYPAMLITGGLNDPRVTYWEPAKWAAKLRHEKTDDNLLLLKINMGAGHGGKSGRYASLYEIAEEYVFLMKIFGKA
jgi:oligopeptidase B